MRRTNIALLAIGTFLATACGDSGAELTVDIETDLAPGLEFTSIRTEVGPSTGGASFEAERTVVRRVGNDAVAEGELRDGARAAELTDVATTDLVVRVSLLDAEGRTVVERLTRVDLNGNFGLTVVLTRNCAGVMCPAPGGAPELLACLAGECVDPRCHPQSPEYCPPPECTVDADCESGSMCAPARCGDEGVCFLSPRSDMCAANEQCHPELGCVPGLEPPPADGGVPPDAGATCGTICFDPARPCFAGYYACDGDAGPTCTELVQVAAGTACGAMMACDVVGDCVAAP